MKPYGCLHASARAIVPDHADGNALACHGWKPSGRYIFKPHHKGTPHEKVHAKSARDTPSVEALRKLHTASTRRAEFPILIRAEFPILIRPPSPRRAACMPPGPSSGWAPLPLRTAPDLTSPNLTPCRLLALKPRTAPNLTPCCLLAPTARSKSVRRQGGRRCQCAAQRASCRRSWTTTVRLLKDGESQGGGIMYSLICF
eukprot:359471-Chlamydomonas_euryale.AAC.2